MVPKRVQPETDMGEMPMTRGFAMTAMLLGTALFLATIVIAVASIVATVIGSLPRILEVFGQLAPRPGPQAQPRICLAPVTVRR